MPKPRIASSPTDRLRAARDTYAQIQRAIASAIVAGSPRTLARLRAARSSVKGAIRHAEGRTYRREYS